MCTNPVPESMVTKLASTTRQLGRSAPPLFSSARLFGLLLIVIVREWWDVFQAQQFGSFDRLLDCERSFDLLRK